MRPLEKLLPLLKNVQDHGDYRTARCPAHDDHQNSLSVKETTDQTLLVKCHAGCKLPEICYSVGLTVSDLFPPKRAKLAEYVYRDASGNPSIKAVKYAEGGSKTFRQFSYVGGKWEPGLKKHGTKPIPYRLDDLAKLKPGETVYIAEGEKDVDALASRGLHATCNLAGAGKWRKSDSEALRGMNVVILADNDQPGEAHAVAVAVSLRGIAESVKIVRFPELPAHGDVSDFFAAGGTVEQLQERAVDPPAESAPEEAGELPSDPFTDRRNAEIFVEKHGNDSRYCFPWKCWLVWDGTRWRRDTTNQVMIRAKTVFDTWMESVEGLADEDAKPVISHARKSASTPGIKNFLTQAAPMVPVEVEDLNGQPWLLNCPNGTVDLRTGELRPHERADMLTVMCPTNFNPDAGSFEWDRFLESVFARHGDVIPFLQRLCGSALVGKVHEHILPILWGSGGNGKTTLLDAIMGTLGTDYSMQAVPEMLMDTGQERHHTERADLFGKRFVAAVETEQNRRLKESLVKGLTGGDRIRARRLWENNFEWIPSHTIFLATNHKPRVYGDDEGIWRRLRLIPFVETFKGKSDDKNLAEKLQAEAEGILAWMVQGCLDWQAQGLNEPETVLQATQEYRGESDVIGQFIESECYINPGMQVRFSDFFAVFEKWCTDNGESHPKQRSVGNYLSDRFEKVRSNGIWYRGLGVRS